MTQQRTGRHRTVATSLPDAVRRDIGAALAAVDADLARRYPGDPGTRQPVHTVYVPADAFAEDTVHAWGDQALAALDAHAPDAAALAAVLGLPDHLAGPVHARVRAKLARTSCKTYFLLHKVYSGPKRFFLLISMDRTIWTDFCYRTLTAEDVDRTRKNIGYSVVVRVHS